MTKWTFCRPVRKKRARALEKIRIDIGKCYVVSIDRRGWNVVQKLRGATANDQQIGLLVMPVR